MSDLRFLVQGSEAFGPRMARRTRMGSRKDAKTRRGKRGCPGLLIFASLRLERSRREHCIWDLFRSRQGQAGEAKPQSLEGDGGNNRATVRDGLLRLIVAVENPGAHKTGDEPCRVQ